MKLTFEKKSEESNVVPVDFKAVEKIRETLGSQNRIDPACIGLSLLPNRTINDFLKSIVGPGDEVLTVGPTGENIFRAITLNDASYYEFYERPLFLPDSQGLIARVTKRTKAIILGNPNRFNGIVYSQKEIENILNISSDVMVILDESTFEMSRITAFELINKYDNLALIRSFEIGINNRIEFLIGNSSVISKAEIVIFDRSFTNSRLANILFKLKTGSDRLAHLKDGRQEMLYLSLRLRMFGLNCFLTPDYSLVVNTVMSEELMLQLNKAGVRALGLARFPGLNGYILIPYNIEIDAISIIDIIENSVNAKIENKPENKRLAILHQSESVGGRGFEEYHNVKPTHRLESNIVF